MDLARDRSQLKRVELLIGRDEREIGVLRDTPRATLRRIERPGLGDDVLRAAPLPGLGIAIPAHDVALAIAAAPKQKTTVRNWRRTRRGP